MDKKTSPAARTYYFLANFLDTNITELFAGISIGIAINLATGQDLSDLALAAIGLLLVSVIFQLTLTRIRQRINQDLADRDGLAMTARDKWRAAAGYDNKWRVGIFFTALVLGLVSFSYGIHFIDKSKQKSDYSLEAQLRQQQERITQLEADSMATHAAMRTLTDSVFTILREKTIAKK